MSTSEPLPPEATPPAPTPARERARDGAREGARKPDLGAWAILIALGVIWGGAFTTKGAAVRELPPVTVVAARLVVAAVVLLPLSVWLAGGLPDWRAAEGRRVWAAAFGAAVAANALPFALLAWAQTHIASSLAGVFMASMPLLVLPLAAWFVPGERLTALKLVGFVIGFIGVLTLLGVDALAGVGAGDALALLAQLACVGAATGYAIGSIITKLSPPAHPVAFGAATISLAALMILPFAFLLEAPLAAPWTPSAAAAVVALGLFPTGLAMVLLYEVLRRAGPSFLSLVNYQVPVWAIVFGVALLGETVPAQLPPALGLILLGVAVSQWSSLSRIFGGRRGRAERARAEEERPADAPRA